MTCRDEVPGHGAGVRASADETDLHGGVIYTVKLRFIFMKLVLNFNYKCLHK